MKKAIKELKKQLNAEVIELANAIKEDRRNIDELSVKYIRHMKRVSELFAELENKADRYEIKTIAKHVQNLEAERCSCHTNTQKTNKNATEGQESGKKEYSEVIISNETFEEELEKVTNEIYIHKTGIVDVFGVTIKKYVSHENGIGYITALVAELQEKVTFVTTTEVLETVKSKLHSKGEHNNKNHDRYANFKDALARNKEEQPHLFANWTVVDKINSYKDKHIQWLIDTRGTEQTKTDLQEAYIDVICYCIMCYIYLKFNPEVKNG